MSAYHLLAVDLEPTPYKVDLWNAFATSNQFTVEVLYTNAKDVSPDAGHDYQELPTSKFHSTVFYGHSLLDSIKKMIDVIRAIASPKVDGVFISGYVNVAPLVAILTSILIQKSFFVHSDIFNLNDPKGSFRYIKKIIRDTIRLAIFKFAKAILVCGRLGFQSALEAGCPPQKIVDFPYVIDIDRLLLDIPSSVPGYVSADIQSGRLILYFSGRMIARKGLATLINALARLGDSSDQKNWVLWIEGDGPLRESYLQQIEHLQLGNHCRMIGFAQMSLHSFLIRNADVVIVPSQSDAWGIVVDEGMQLGKVVIASRGVGSAIDRITHLENGLLFDAEDEDVLRQSLALVLENHELRKRLSSCAQETTLSFKPVRNQMHLSQILKI